MIQKKTIQREVEVTEKLFCDECGSEIPLVIADQSDNGGPTEQGIDALGIALIGGYGMFVDPLCQFNLRRLLCKICANKLCSTFKCFKEFALEEVTDA